MKSLCDWLKTAGVLVGATAAALILENLNIGRASLLMVYMIGVMCCASITHGYRYSVSEAAASMLLFNFLFTVPRFTFQIDRMDDVILLFFFLITAVLSAAMTCRFRSALEISQENERRAEMLAEEKNRALRQAEQAHMRSSLLRSIGHDLRTPLTGIQCGINYLAESGSSLSPEELHRVTDDLDSQIGWLITLVENILYMTRLENARLEVNKTPEVVDDVVYEAVSHLPGLKEHPFTCDLPEQVLTVPMDGKMIVQVLVNLLGNAVSHTEKGTPIRLSVRPAGARMLFSVEDGGGGIPPEQRQEIFKSFVTSGKVSADGRKGVGLGLAICDAVIRAHGGEITVSDSEALGGAAFRFWLPKGEQNDD